MCEACIHMKSLRHVLLPARKVSLYNSKSETVEVILICSLLTNFHSNTITFETQRATQMLKYIIVTTTEFN